MDLKKKFTIFEKNIICFQWKNIFKKFSWLIYQSEIRAVNKSGGIKNMSQLPIATMKALIAGGAQKVFKINVVPAIFNQKLSMSMGLGKLDENMQNLDKIETSKLTNNEESELPSIIDNSYMEKLNETLTLDYYFQDKKKSTSMNPLLISAQKANIKSELCLYCIVNNISSDKITYK